MDEKPDLYKLFKVDNEHIAKRAVLDQLGHHIRRVLAAGHPTVRMELDREISATLASILIIDDPAL